MTITPARKIAPRRSPLRTEPIIAPEAASAMLNTAPPMAVTTTRPRRRMPKVWKIIAWAFGTIILVPLAIAIVIGSVEGIAGTSSSAPQAVAAGDPYHDCLTLADRDRFAPEVCEPLNPNAKVATNAIAINNFNDGFATSKQDDCAQGFAKACDWLKIK